jgi:hypothetical protein
MLSRYAPLWRLRGEDVQLLLDLKAIWAEWSASRLSRALPMEKGPAVPAVQEAG